AAEGDESRLERLRVRTLIAGEDDHFQFAVGGREGHLLAVDRVGEREWRSLCADREFVGEESDRNEQQKYEREFAKHCFLLPLQELIQLFAECFFVDDALHAKTFFPCAVENDRHRQLAAESERVDQRVLR